MWKKVNEEFVLIERLIWLVDKKREFLINQKIVK